MAIKVSGNTVIDNSRNLVGVSSITFSDGTVQSTAGPQDHQVVVLISTSKATYYLL